MNGPGGGGGGGPAGGGPGGGGPAGGAGGGAGGPGGPRAVRRSRSQGTRKLHKCLSTASDVYAAPPAPQHSLLTTRQYCSFGSTVTFIRPLGLPSDLNSRNFSYRFVLFFFFFLSYFDFFNFMFDGESLEMMDRCPSWPCASCVLLSFGWRTCQRADGVNRLMFIAL